MYTLHKHNMRIKNGVPGQTRDAAAAEAVWGSPGPTKVQSKKQLQSGQNEADENDSMNIRQLPKQPTMLSLTIKPAGELEQKRIATGRYASAANLARRSPQTG
jgi:hypothetical protein